MKPFKHKWLEIHTSHPKDIWIHLKLLGFLSPSEHKQSLQTTTTPLETMKTQKELKLALQTFGWQVG